MLKDKTILVAGAGGLLGARITRGILKSHGNVLAFDNDLPALEKALIKESAGVDTSKLELVQLDITDEQAVKHFFSSISGIDGAINCTYPRNTEYGADFFDVTQNSFNENIALQLGSTFLFMQECAKYYRKYSKLFSLVNISSIYGVIPPRFDVYEGTQMTMPVEYAAVKAAILHLNKYVSAYMRESNFRVNSVSPGGIRNGQPDAFVKAYNNYSRGQGMLEPDDVVGAIIFLLSNGSQFVTGQNIIVDDGFHL